MITRPELLDMVRDFLANGDVDEYTLPQFVRGLLRRYALDARLQRLLAGELRYESVAAMLADAAT